MADLDAFFSKANKKRDQKKKLVARQGSGGHALGESGDGSRKESLGTGLDGNGKSDVWIEFEETKHAQVHTGGKTIVELKRDEINDRDGNSGDHDNSGEKFPGWNVAKKEEAAEEESTPKDNFPTLADAAKVKVTPAAKPTKKAPPRRRPNQFAALRDMLGQQESVNAAMKPNPGAAETVKTQSEEPEKASRIPSANSDAEKGVSSLEKLEATDGRPQKPNVQASIFQQVLTEAVADKPSPQKSEE